MSENTIKEALRNGERMTPLVNRLIQRRRSRFGQPIKLSLNK